jgi:ABC-type branched-subunit amino acid transport system substrate-binding protein
MNRPVRARAAAAIISLALVAACSSEGSSGGANNASTSTTKPDTSLLGPNKPATGAALKVGFITDGQTAAVDARPEAVAAKAAASYVNDHLGGVAGRKLELVTCETHLTPAGAKSCANKMVAAKVPIVLSAAPGEPGSAMTVLQAAGIPYFFQATIDTTVLTSPDAYVLTNTLGGLASPVKVAQDAGAKKVAMLLIDVPAAVGPVKAVGKKFFDDAGISVDYIAVPPGTPDMTPQVQAAIGRGAEMFMILGDPAFCISALSALSTLGFTGTKLVIPQCLNPDVAKSVPGGLDGVKLSTTEALDASDKEVALYEAVLDHYAPGTPPHVSATSGGYAIVLAFARAMTGHQGEFTPESVKQSLESMKAQPQPLLSGQTFKCDRKLFALTPPVCSSGIAIVTLDADGKQKDSKAFDAAPIING